MIDFGVLGHPLARPLVAKVRPSQRREWTIMGALLLRPNASITTDDLVDTLWDREPPRTAREQVLNCVSALRRALDVAEDVQIVRSGERHTLVIDPQRVDHVVFDRLRIEAVQSTRRGDIKTSIEQLRAALSLWRGQVLDGLELRSLAPAAARLNELRAATAESYFDAYLAVGAGAQIVAELTEHVGYHPLRERGVWQLMLALHRAGRNHDAHRAFVDLAVRLERDLGIEPGPEAVGLHAEIIAARSPRAGLPPVWIEERADFGARRVSMKRMAALR